ncbi:hypothetical protein JOS77_03840 [Chromobacterium haemolyticum]|nr:hypothetical protein JOS77_03840 [Chromobacterium haemolyticum]
MPYGLHCLRRRALAQVLCEDSLAVLSASPCPEAEKMADAIDRPSCIIKKIEYAKHIVFDANFMLLSIAVDVSLLGIILIFIFFN